MRLFLKIIFLSFLFLNTPLFAENLKIAYINMEQIMVKSKSGISINEQLDKLHQSNIQKFKKMQDDLKREETKIVAQKNILEKSEYQKQINDLRAKANKYREIRAQTINDITNKRIEAINNLLKIINPILIQYSKDNSIAIIIQKKNIVVGVSELDITASVMKLINEKIQKVSIK